MADDVTLDAASLEQSTDTSVGSELAAQAAVEVIEAHDDSGEPNLKTVLNKEFKIVDEALSEDEFLAKVASRNIFARFERYISVNARTLNDYEAILKSTSLKIILLVGVVVALFLFSYTKTFYPEESRKELIGYIKVNHKLPKDFKGKIDAELEKVIEEYVKPYQKQQHPVRPAEADEANLVLMSTKYPGPISNQQLLLILEEQGVGKVTAKGTEYTEKINLAGLDLKNINFKYLNRFIQSDLRHADMRGVKIEQALFRGAKLANADMSQAILIEASFIRARISNLKLRAAELTDANFYGAVGENLLMDSALLARANFKETDLLEPNFESTVLFDSNFQNASLQGANFMGADLHNANFQGADLTAANFRGANLEGANFKNAILDGVNFRMANLLNTSLEKASLNNAFLDETENLTMEQLESAQFAYNAETLPEWVNKRKLSWQRRF